MNATQDKIRVRSSRPPNGAIVAAAFAVLALAACGSSASKASTTTPTQGSSPTTRSANSTSGIVVAAATNSKFGAVLVDRNGRTLYTLTKNGQPVACAGPPCSTAWPPLLLTSGATTASGGAGITGLGTVSANGGLQVTKDGAPLHRFAGDSAPGDATGDGISSFGGVWHVVKVAAATNTVTTSAPSVTTTTATGGYHY
jgi:predicted lipoprotein with Yx(FWY)xxD motif